MASVLQRVEYGVDKVLFSCFKRVQSDLICSYSWMYKRRGRLVFLRACLRRIIAILLFCCFTSRVQTQDRI